MIKIRAKGRNNVSITINKKKLKKYAKKSKSFDFDIGIVEILHFQISRNSKNNYDISEDTAGICKYSIEFDELLDFILSRLRYLDHLNEINLTIKVKVK